MGLNQNMSNSSEFINNRHGINLADKSSRHKVAK
jgi:hypothetical protein